MSDDNLKETIVRLIKTGEALRIELERELHAANERIKRLENAIDRAANRFFDDGPDGQTAAEMLKILEESRKAKP
jgi:peptidoglycan/xylan/chitin deacetylase (PgdA/CDA1 family)